jgi:hypothetical protein
VRLLRIVLRVAVCLSGDALVLVQGRAPERGLGRSPEESRMALARGAANAALVNATDATSRGNRCNSCLWRTSNAERKALNGRDDR